MSSGPADWISAIVGVFALFAVWIEYMRQKRMTRQQLAQDLSARFDTDEMIAFAVTTMDWGTGILVVPEPWREVVAAPALSWNIADIRDAVHGTLTETTRVNPVRLLYRHAFVHLFNHIERISQLEQVGALRIEDLRFVAWLAYEITDWRYAPAGEEREFFKGALDLWYPNSELHSFLERICSKFPKA